MEQHQFVFIAGLHRSGTSILFQCLREHPLMSGFRETGVDEDEGQFLQSVYPVARRFGGPGRFGFYPQMHWTEASPLATPESARRLYADWLPYWDAGRPYLLEKSPPNLLKTRFLQALFPRSYFIVVLRHPVAVAYATRKWSWTTLSSLVRHWLVCHELFERDRARLRNVLVLKFEEFVQAPDAHLDATCRFLGAPPLPARPAVRSDTNAKYFHRWERLRRLPFFRRYVGRMIRQYEARANQFGYSLADLGWLGPHGAGPENRPKSRATEGRPG